MKVLRFLLGLAFGTAGVLHFTRERQFRNIIPDYLLLQKTAVLVTGVIEIFLGIMSLVKRPASWLKRGINSFLLAVFPANIYMARKGLPLSDKELPKWAPYSGLPLQFMLIKAIRKL